MASKKVSLGQVATLQRGFDLPTTKRIEGDIPVVSSAGISGFHNESKVMAPGIVTGRYGSVGKFYYLEKNFWPLNTTLWVKDFHANNPKYVYYLLSSLNFEKFSDKTGVPGVNRNDLHKIKIPYIERDRQDFVVQLFEQWDTAIEKTEALIDAKERRFTGKLYQLIGSKEATLNLGNVCKLEKGVRLNKNSNGFPYLEIGNIDIKTKDYNIEKKNKNAVSGAVKVPKNTLLISTVRPTRGAVTKTHQDIYVSSAFCKLKIKN